MSLYRVTTTKLEPVPRTTFAAENLLERKDIQRLLKEDISPLGDDLMVIAEEYGDWEDSSRRIDLLCLSKDASLVVVEIKRTEDGGHMELQALRYAAMVSSMTLEQVIRAYAEMAGETEEEAREEVLGFLQPSAEDDEPKQLGDVRIVLVSADFSTELTTAVLWLNRHELDITCIRLRPYRSGPDLLIDATQIIPLPESADYEVKLRAQEDEKRKVLGNRQKIFQRFWTQYIERSMSRTSLLSNRGAPPRHWLPSGFGRSGFSLTSALTRTECSVECYIRPREGEAKAAFKALLAQRATIEAKFGEALEWQELPDRQGCRICKDLPGGWTSPEADWPEIQDRMLDALVRLEGALKKPIQDLKL